MTTCERLSQVNNAPTTELIKEEISKFTPEQRDLLERENFVIYTLTGKSIKELSKVEKFWDLRGLLGLDYKALSSRSRKSEIAILKDFFLPESNSKTLSEQQELVDMFSEEVSQKIPGVKSVLGNYTDYSELGILDRDLFISLNYPVNRYNSEYASHYARTQDQFNIPSEFQKDEEVIANINVGYMYFSFTPLDNYPHFIFDIDINNPDNRDSNLYIAPLIVPDNK